MLVSYEPVPMLSEAQIQDLERRGSLAEQAVCALSQKHLQICCAESCTGGLLSGTLVNVSGASAVLNESYVTYSNEAKQRLLGVSKDTLAECGAVSFETAAQMAAGAARVSGAAVGIGITGIAGPTGGTVDKPVGLVYIGICCARHTVVAQCHFSGDRLQVRNSAVKQALALLLEQLARSFNL